MPAQSPDFEVKISRHPALVAAAQRLRYEVFVAELGGSGADVDHAARREGDRFDAAADHLVLIDRAEPRNGGVVGCYRLLTQDAAGQVGGFYSAGEFDLAPVLSQQRRVLELGRSCLHPAYRGGTAMFEMWSGLTQFVEARGIDTLFGVASFPGSEVACLVQPLSYLYHAHLAPEPLRVRAHGPQARAMNMLRPDQIDRRAALAQIPALLKGYLRLGGVVGDGAWVDAAFNTVDVCLVMDMAKVGPRYRAIYGAQARQ